MPRPRTGSISWRDGIAYVRIYQGKDRATGKAIRPWICLNTSDPAEALRRAKKALADADKGLMLAPVSTSKHAFGPYADTWREAREARGVASAESEKGLLKNHINPEIGALALPDVTIRTLRALLTKLIEKKLSRQTIVHAMGTVGRVLRQAFEDELIERVPEMPRIPDLHEVDKQRAQLTDEELRIFWECPKVESLELKLMVLTARVEGGMRTRDVTSWDWTMIDRPGFGSCVVPRTKTGLPQRLEIPEVLQGPLLRWWVAQGSPAEGPVFPVTKGKRKGEPRRTRGVSFAGRLRRALLLAGITRHELHHETAVSLPVGFHSACRGGFSTALAEGDVDGRKAAGLTGHADERTHQKYVLRTSRMQKIPDCAVPRIATGIATGPKGGSKTPERDTGFEPATLSLGSRCTSGEPNDSDWLRDGLNGCVSQRFAVNRGEVPRIATGVDGVDGSGVVAEGVLAEALGGAVLRGIGAGHTEGSTTPELTRARDGLGVLLRRAAGGLGPRVVLDEALERLAAQVAEDGGR